MPSTGREKAKAKRSIEIDILSNYRKMDVMLGGDNSYSIERELENVIPGPIGHNDTKTFPHLLENSSQEN